MAKGYNNVVSVGKLATKDQNSLICKVNKGMVRILVRKGLKMKVQQLRIKEEGGQNEVHGEQNHEPAVRTVNLEVRLKEIRPVINHLLKGRSWV